MLECLHCNHENEDSAEECTRCNRPLYSLAVIDPRSTDALPEVQALKSKRTEPGSEIFKPGMVLTMHVEGDDRAIRIRPKDALLFGRNDPTLRVAPEVDLTEYSGASQGVSRAHAALRTRDDYLVLIDMASANGTYLNGEKLLPHHPKLVRDGDTIQLGRMLLIIQFEE